MKISTRGRYAIRFMLDLADHSTGSPVKLKDIADRQNISVKYLEHIASTLHRASLVTSVKGAGGGYLLSGSPSGFTVGQILKATEGSMAPAECVGAGGTECQRKSTCVSFRIWDRLNTAIDTTLEGITLGDLISWQDELKTESEYVI
ncbi:MAG: RrF2 family transcriptional regulator [Oscillospiraceae bacterium]|nr:RrF2 family transcriptional regulator [Oscillospiraceae bacterium]